MADWTVMIYMASNNNLAEESVWAITEIEKLADADVDIDIVVHLDTFADNRLLFDLSIRRGAKSFNGKRRQRLRRKSLFPARDLKTFILETAKTHPAEKFALILSGHGSGGVVDFLKQGDPLRALSIPALGEVLQEFKKETKKKIAILGMDACAMGIVEVGFEVASYVDFLVGAEGFEINTGWPYGEILKRLVEESEKSPQQFACEIVETYINFYKPYVDAGVSVDLAACRVSKGQELTQAINHLATVLIEEMKKPTVLDAVILAHWRAQSYKFEDYTDIWDFCDLLERGCSEKSVQGACAEVKKNISNEKNSDGEIYSADYAPKKYVLKSCYFGAEFQHSHGVAAYFPWARDERILKRYKNLRFSKKTKWNEFLDEYLKGSKREKRGTGPARVSPKNPNQDVLMLLGVRTDPPNDLRTDPPNDLRTDPPNDLRILGARIPRVKNPPTEFVEKPCECEE